MRPPVQRSIQVYADWEGLGKATVLGALTVTPTRGREIFAFAYDPVWLKSGYSQLLDPALCLFSGPQYPSGGKTNFGVFLDSSPDRWGRFLMDRREAQAAREEGRPRQVLRDSD